MNSPTYRTVTWRDPRQTFRASPIQGIGTFALADIPVGDVVEIIGGLMMDEAEFQLFVQQQPRFNAIQIDEGLHLVELPEITAQRGGGSINHACDSNLWLADAVTLVARRPIAAGEELTVDYALFSGTAGLVLTEACRCGANVCRHQITGDDWRIPEVQERYYPHFSPFITVRITQMRSATRSN